MTMEEVLAIQQRARNGEEVPVEVLQECVMFMRQDRVSADMSKKPKEEKAPAVQVSLDDLLA